jgi:UDP-glucose 4-epimerase
MVIPRLVRQALAGEPLTVYGDGQQSRCFCHVADVVRALVGLLDRDEAVGEVFNIGSSEEVTIRELAERVIERSESSSTVALVPYADAYAEGFEDMRRRVPDTTKIREFMDWQPRRSLDDILGDAIADARDERVAVDGASNVHDLTDDADSLAGAGVGAPPVV